MFGFHSDIQILFAQIVNINNDTWNTYFWFPILWIIRYRRNPYIEEDLIANLSSDYFGSIKDSSRLFVSYNALMIYTQIPNWKPVDYRHNPAINNYHTIAGLRTTSLDYTTVDFSPIVMLSGTKAAFVENVLIIRLWPYRGFFY